MPGSRSLRALPVLALLLAALGCSGGEDPAPTGTPQPGDHGTPLASYDTGGVAVAREPFCDLLDGAAADALGGEPTSSEQYGNGDRTRLAPGVRDVAHEFGCRHERGAATAHAWLFAPPVTPARARALVADARDTRGCTADAEAPPFGSPTVALLCRGRRTATASYRGLFGDAWLSCSVTVPEPGVDRSALVDRTGRWCVAVAEAAAS